MRASSETRLECAARGEEPLTAAQLAALRLDERAVRVARGQGAIELALGRVVNALYRGDRLLQLGFSRHKDYANGGLGIRPRTVRTWTELARGLETRAVLRRAVEGGLVSPRKAREIMAAATGRDEARWTAAAMRRTLTQLQAMLRGEGHALPDTFEIESLTLRMTPLQQDRLDIASAIARDHLGPAAKPWQCLEAICQEWLGSFGAWAPEEMDDGAPENPPMFLMPSVAHAEDRALAAQLVAVNDARDIIDDGVAGRSAEWLHGRACEFLEARRQYDAAFGPLAREMRRTRGWETLGYRSFAEYCRERLGMSAQTVRDRAWLENRLVDLPELREALAKGKVTYSKALLIAKGATAFNVEERIEQAASTTWQQVERDTTDREREQNRAAGIRRLWGPRDAAGTVASAILCAQGWAAAVCGEEIDAGEALARIADHFTDVWGRHAVDPGSRARRRREILARTRGLCAVPGCSRAAVHVHHIVFRSRGGPKAEWNEIGVCVPHHLHGIHRGYLTVRGRAGETLVWEFGAQAAVPLEVWITRGGDDVRRSGPRRIARDREPGHRRRASAGHRGTGRRARAPTARPTRAAERRPPVFSEARREHTGPELRARRGDLATRRDREPSGVP